MEALSAELMLDTEIDELSLIDQLDFSSLDIEFTSPTIWGCFQEKNNSVSNNCSSPAVEEPEKSAVATAQRWSSSCAIPGIVSFGNPRPLEDQRRENGDGGLKPMEAARAEITTGAPWHGQTKRARSRPLAPNQEHVFAERQRRTKITQKLIELAAIIPGLKKRDKASILTAAIEYAKQMEQKVKTHEEQIAATKEAMELTVAGQKCKLSALATGSNGLNSDGTISKIEARLSESTVLIRIHCQDRKGILLKALTDIESLHLSVTNASSIPFSDHLVVITATAEVEQGFSMTVKDLLNKLNTALREYV